MDNKQQRIALFLRYGLRTAVFLPIFTIFHPKTLVKSKELCYTCLLYTSDAADEL